MTFSGITGLTLSEVKSRKSLGLVNKSIDSYSPSYLRIFLSNILSLINIVIFPLVVSLFLIGLYKEIFAFSTFLIVNTIVSIFDQVRVKRTLDKLKSQFNIKVSVLRESKLTEVSASEVVVGEVIFAKDGDSIVADGKIIQESYLQVDESSLTGESNYLRKFVGEEIKAGSFVVTGWCLYKAENVGKSNYINKLGAEALTFKEKKSKLQKSSDRLIVFLVFASVILSILNFISVDSSRFSQEEKLLSITTIVSLVIPQTLIFLSTLAFTISITKLYRKGVLVQKGGSIEDLSYIDTICFDKTGTITTNKMSIVGAKFWNIEEEEFGRIYSSVSSKLVSVNKTQELINNRYSNHQKLSFSDLSQIPFNSRIKFSLVQARFKDEFRAIILGAWEVIRGSITQALSNEVSEVVERAEHEGFRVLAGIVIFDYLNIPTNVQSFLDLDVPKTDKVCLFFIKEELNFGITEIFEKLKFQGIDVKIISGDSKNSVQRILSKVGIGQGEKVVDLSLENLEEIDVSRYFIFCRAKPEDKLFIVDKLKKLGRKVCMVGDGVNDVLGLKAADVSISLESGTKVAREVSDIVLLKNDFTKINLIFYEGENIIYNLMLSTKLFLLKCLYSIFLAIYFSFLGVPIPLMPNSTLIFSFLGSSAPGYIIVFTRQQVLSPKSFFSEVFRTTIPASIFIALSVIAFYHLGRRIGYEFISINTLIVLVILTLSAVFTIYFIVSSKKINNLLYALTYFHFIMFLGFFQTLLPVASLSDVLSGQFPMNFTNWNKLVLLFGLLAFVAMFGVVFLIIWRPFSLWKLIVVFFCCTIVSVVASVFPFREYYNVINLSWFWYVFLYLTGIFFIYLIFKLKITRS
ncbi:HAD family hydrolase [Candidatus Dojkabacteria bacterium]|uniref:HAD family hydrolase n=1 Tax=Candidatus Dojkabacteria bacterium TaxID=2099670 RepID=A0A3M0Z2F6_9BACT|nr:MAG: HAD family hydrolase [Candidatus Dojkabacteria bacterium]